MSYDRLPDAIMNEVCAAHARALLVRWFDDADARVSPISMAEPKTPPVADRSEPARYQAVVTVKGKPGHCDQPATVDRGGHMVCPKHDRAVWLTYIDADRVAATWWPTDAARPKETAPARGALRPSVGLCHRGAGTFTKSQIR